MDGKIGHLTYMVTAWSDTINFGAAQRLQTFITMAKHNPLSKASGWIPAAENLVSLWEMMCIPASTQASMWVLSLRTAETPSQVKSLCNDGGTVGH